LKAKKPAAEKQVDVRITDMGSVANDIRYNRLRTVKINSSEDTSEYLVLNELPENIYGDKYNFWSRVSRLYNEVPAFKAKIGDKKILYAKSTSALNNIKKYFGKCEDAFTYVLNAYKDVEVYNAAKKEAERCIIDDYMLETVEKGLPALYNSEDFQKLKAVKISNISKYYTESDKVKYDIDFIEEVKEPEYDKEFFDYAKTLYYMYDRYYDQNYKNAFADLVELKFAAK
jgi:hypothetical protein